MDHTAAPKVTAVTEEDFGTVPVGLATQISNGLAVFGLPIVLVAAIIASIINRWLFATPVNVAIAVTFYILSGFGVTAGFHRLFTHRSFETGKILRGIFAVLGSMSVQGPVIDWVATHRKHHAYADEDGDPHSPHAGHKGGSLRGFVHAHYGWLFAAERADPQRFAQGLLDDSIISAVSRLFLPIVLLTMLVIPFALGLAITGTVVGGLGTILWGGVVRVFFLHHATWSVNSACHIWGKRPFKTDDQSTNNLYVALVGLGEGNHHNHHAFPRSAKHGLLPWQFDPTWWLIWSLQKLGLVWNVVLVSPAKMESKRKK